ncbi:MAG: Gfo/Idh/MocA family oxidoreductase [Pirellula sp.]|nr:Gfo/Idh/MocA family oxidoreductase [Pirellula sp.]
MSLSNDVDSRNPRSDQPRSIAFFGGGRWGSILFGELYKQVSPSTNLVWVTRDAEKKKIEWLRKPTHANIEFIDAWQDRLVECDGAIVATSIDRHYSLSRDLLSAAVPVLCEKPIAATCDQLRHLRQLAKESQCPFGVHLEFAFLTSFDDFVDKSKAIEVKQIQVEWFDPEIEIRDGMEKRAEYQCDIISDQLPHVWSLICRAVSSEFDAQFDSLHYSPARTTVSGTIGDVSVEVQLSRRHTQRRRFISFNAGEATFDFHIEPPTATFRNKPLGLTASFMRPLQYTVSSFLSQVEAYRISKLGLVSEQASDEDHPKSHRVSSNWVLSVENYHVFLLQCLGLSERLRATQDGLISQMLLGGNLTMDYDASLTEEHTQLILDRWLPKGIESGASYRPSPHTNDRELAIQIVRSLYRRS